MKLEDNELNVGVAASPRGSDPRETGKKIAKEAMESAGKKHAPVAFAMFHPFLLILLNIHCVAARNFSHFSQCMPE